MSQSQESEQRHQVRWRAGGKDSLKETFLAGVVCIRTGRTVLCCTTTRCQLREREGMRPLHLRGY